MARHGCVWMAALVLSVATASCSSGLPDEDESAEPGAVDGATTPDGGPVPTGGSTPPGGGGTTPGTGSTSGPATGSMDAGASSGAPPVPGDVRGEADRWARAGKSCNAEGFYEPNDAAAQACRVTLLSQVDSALAAPNDTIDYFAFHGVKGVTYTLTVDSTECTSGIYVRAWAAASGAPVTQVDETLGIARRSWELTPKATGEERLAFSLSSGSCAYAFTVYPSVAAGLVQNPETFEPNDTASTAKPLGKPGTEVKSGLSHPRDREDNFTVEVVKDVTYTLSLNTLGCLGRVWVDGWALGSGQEVQNINRDFYNYKADLEFKANATGLERLRFTLSEQSCAYTFTVLPSTSAGLVHDTMRFEPNDTPATAFKPSSRAITSEVAAPLDSSDYYTFDVQAGVTHTLTLSRVGCSGIGLRVFSPTGITTVDRMQYDARASYELPSTAAGPLLVHVVLSSGSCGYTLELTP